MTFTVALGQFNPKVGDLDYNRNKCLAIAEEARNRGADLLVLPELGLTGYLLRDQSFACGLARNDSFLDPFKELSRDLSITIGLVERSEDHRYFNSAFYYEGGALKHVHRKIYLPTYGIFEEKRFFAEGSRIQAFDSRFGRTGIVICNDLWHPSVPWLLAMDGADLFIVPGASPTRGVSIDAVNDNTRVWDLLLSHTAKTTSSFVLFANICGYQDGINFWGGSKVYAPNGRIIAQAGGMQEEIVVAKVDEDLLRRERIYSPLRRDERLLLTYHELSRIVQESYR